MAGSVAGVVDVASAVRLLIGAVEGALVASTVGVLVVVVAGLLVGAVVAGLIDVTDGTAAVDETIAGREGARSQAAGRAKSNVRQASRRRWEFRIIKPVSLIKGRATNCVLVDDQHGGATYTSAAESIQRFVGCRERKRLYFGMDRNLGGQRQEFSAIFACQVRDGSDGTLAP
jgi:hypothetical protein